MTTETAPPQVDPRADDSAVWLARRAGVPAVWARYTDLVVDRGEGRGSSPRTATATSTTPVASGSRTRATPIPGWRRPSPSRQAGSSTPSRTSCITSPAWSSTNGCRATSPVRAGWPPPDEIGLFLSNSGAEAIEAAVKLAKIATHRPAIVAFRGGFHGRTHGTMSLTSSAIKNRGHYEPLLASVYFAPYPYRCGPRPRPGRTDARGALAWTMSQLDELFATLVFPEDVAAFLVEPVLGEGGYVVPPDGFLPALREQWPTATGSCSSSTRCSPATAARAASSPPSGVASAPTSWSWPRALPRACRCPASSPRASC